MSSYRKQKHIYNDNWEDSHPFTDRVAVTCGDDDPEISHEDDLDDDSDHVEDDEEMDWK